MARARAVAWRGAGLAALATGSAGIVVAAVPQAWAGLFTREPAVLATAETYLRIAGPAYAFFGAGLALYFVGQGAGRPGWPVVSVVGRMAVALGGGSLAAGWLGRGIAGLAAAVALSFVVSGSALALATRASMRPATRRPDPPLRSNR
jgi:MATE family, multidrug efflux pump